MNKRVLFQHIRDKAKPNGGVTIAIEVTDINNEPHATAWAVSRCHEKDNFCKRTGRVKSEGRLRSQHYRHPTIHPAPLKPFMEALSHLIQEGGGYAKISG
jgi:hypothetical protein